MSVRELPAKDRPLSEQFRLVAVAYADAEAAASLLEELKTTTLEKLKSKTIIERGDMPDNKAERIVKSSPDWEAYIRQMCDARARATKLKLQLAYIRMRHAEWQAADATARAEMRLGNVS